MNKKEKRKKILMIAKEIKKSNDFERKKTKEYLINKDKGKMN